MNLRSCDRLAWLDDELRSLQANDLLRLLQVRDSSQTAAVRLDGREYINFGANDYLGLAADPRLLKAAAQSMQDAGWGSGASPLVSGRSAMHAALEDQLAIMEGTPAALLFASGYAANVGAIAALVGRGDAVFGDALNHASIIDGCRLSRSDVFVYPHGDIERLDRQLEQCHARRRLIVTDSLFSMDGDLAPLSDLAAIADRHNAMLMVDEAHATGVFGDRGRGVAEHLGVEDRIDIRVGTLSKALGCIGGFVAGSRPLIDWLANRARPYVFSTAGPAAAAAASLAALEIVASEPWRRTDLLSRAESFRGRLRQSGWDVGASQSQIVPLMVGPSAAAMELSAALRERGYYVPAIRPPSVPNGEARLRISLSYAHAPEMIAGLVDALGSPSF